ncbi:hypothetical protein BUZ39_02830 [Staphylococcus haemolyticus]|nr:hypothetical protein BUZ39_02830 [Staphylococcus haemolyticus]
MTLCAGPQQRDFQQENLQAKQAGVEEGAGQNSFEFVVTPTCLARKITFVIFCVGAPPTSARMTRTEKA